MHKPFTDLRRLLSIITLKPHVMKHLLLSCTLGAMFSAACAQNIISNSNFGTYSACPTSGGQMSYCPGWYQATAGTSDYLNSCVSSGGAVDVPQNMAGYQASPSGAYAGFFTYCGQTIVAPDYKEYIATSFPALTIGATYKVTMVVSLGDSAFFATDGLGALFSVNPVYHTTLSTIPRTPQVDFSSYGVISDKVNWVTLTGTFTADSAYANITLGCFKTDAMVSKTVCSYHGLAIGGTDSSAYYYVDSVAVEHISTSFTNAASVGKNGASLYPNPLRSSATLTFSYTAGGNYTFNLFDVTGRAVRTITNITTGSVIIDRGALPGGYYSYQLRSADHLENGKLMIAD